MTVKEIAEKYSFEAVSLPQPDREIKGGYCGDLLSWVMGRAEADNAWITIMTNVNIVAVSALADIAVIIIAEDARPDDGVIETAAAKGVNILLTEDTAFNTAAMISKYI